MKFGFLLFALPFLLLIALASMVVLNSGVAFGVIRTLSVKKIVTWVFILMPIVLVLTMMIGARVYSGINTFFYLITVTWLPILLYLCMGALLLYLIHVSALATGHQIAMYPLALGVIFITFGAVAYGIINATTPRIINYTISSPTLAPDWSGKNIILVSDTHLGIVRSHSFMEKVVSAINSARPDLVLIAGDIIDGPVFNYEKGLSPLKNIHSTYGVIYTPGNHEGYNSEPEKFYPIVKSLSTTLIDERTRIGNTDIIGLNYQMQNASATQTQLTASGFTHGTPTIALLHDPKNARALLDAGVSLVVSGHTHCGQFFPLNLLVKKIYKEYTYGVTTVGDTTAITTCGVGTAMSPLRIGTNPEIVVIHIQ